MCSTIGIYFNITNIKMGFSIFKVFIKFIIKLHLHFVLEWVDLICTCQPSNALQHYVMATNTFCLNFFTHRAGPHVFGLKFYIPGKIALTSYCNIPNFKLAFPAYNKINFIVSAVLVLLL